MPRINARTFASLVYFEACGRLLSFSAAAKELNITTGAVSQQIRKLEESLEFKLFRRHPIGIELTDKGSELLRVTGRTLEEISVVVERLKQSPKCNVVRLRSTPSFVFKWLIPKLKEFNLEHPEIKVETFAEASLLDLEEAEFDVAIDYSYGRYQNFDATLLVKEKLLPVVSPSYMPDADWYDSTTWQQASLLHDAMPWQDATRYAEWRYWLDKSGFDEIASDHGHYFNRSDMALAAADAGLGVALARSFLVEEELKSGRLIAPLASIPSCCNYYLLTPKNQPTSDETVILKAWLASIV